MGWMIGYHSRAELADRLSKGWSTAVSTGQCLKHRFVGFQALWCLYEVVYAPSGPDEACEMVRFVAVHLVRKFREGWGYKSIEDAMGPSEINCPQSYLAGLTIDSQTKRDWLARVREYHRCRGTGVKFKVGQVLSMKAGCTPQQITVTRLVPLTGESGGIRFRIRRGHIDLSRVPAMVVKPKVGVRPPAAASIPKRLRLAFGRADIAP